MIYVYMQGFVLGSPHANMLTVATIKGFGLLFAYLLFMYFKHYSLMVFNDVCVLIGKCE